MTFSMSQAAELGKKYLLQEDKLNRNLIQGESEGTHQTLGVYPPRKINKKLKCYPISFLFSN